MTTNAVATSAGTTIGIDARTGFLSSLAISGREYFAEPLKPNFWRVPTDSDIGWRVPEKMGVWKNAADSTVLESLEREEIAGEVRFRASMRFAEPSLAGASTLLVYSLSDDGRLRVAFQLELGKGVPELPRIGLQFAVPGRLDRTRWYGHGPQENYCDRLTGARIGLHELAAADWLTPYVRPQENGHRAGIRWLELTASGDPADRLSVCAATEPLPGVSIWPCSQKDIEVTTHANFLPSRDFHTVNVDGWLMGVGGDTSWGEPVHAEYRITVPGTYRFGFELSGMSSQV